MKDFKYNVTFNANDYKDYQDFFKDISKKLEADKGCDIEDKYIETLGYDVDWLWEFLWWFHGEDKIHVTLLNFDREKIEQEKTYSDLKIKRILKCFNDLIEEYPENVVEYKNEEKETK